MDSPDPPINAIKRQIQSEYQRVLAELDFRPRAGQRRMIAEIFNTLSQPAREGGGPVCVVEAGTGTGKTLAYLLGALPLAMATGRKLIIATATISLQEQLVRKDIPQLVESSGLQFDYVLAKGRGRYLCRLKLENLLHGGDSRAALRDLFGDGETEAGGDDFALWEAMRGELADGRWRGDRDEWHEPLASDRWQPLTAQRGECSGSRCRLYRKCCFFNARYELDKADCVVANQDLVLTDLALGGGAVLPPPENSIYIFDEAHHLPEKSNRHFAHSIRLRAEAAWLERSATAIGKMREQDLIDSSSAAEINNLLTETGERLQMALLLLRGLRREDGDSYRSRITQSFPLGEAPAELRELAGTLAGLLGVLESRFERVREHLRGQLEEEEDAAGPASNPAETWFPLAGNLLDRAMANRALWDSYGREDQAGEAPWARWLSFDEDAEAGDIGLASSPVLAAGNLQENLWRRCAGAVLTSATLSALGEFSMLRMRAGLPEHSRCLSIPSPFPFAEAASLEVPKMGCEPSASDAHTDCIIRALPALLDDRDSALMLFSSRAQMRGVLAGLPEKWRRRVLCQDDHQKFDLLRKHRARIDRGKGSVIFGLASFAEGIDLPGKYLRHVLIAKIPFAVPTDPVEETLAQWYESEGRNPFMELSVPQAVYRLKQACGRLLRSETDTGRITLFDERVVRKFYGKRILDSLPPFRRELLQRDLLPP